MSDTNQEQEQGSGKWAATVLGAGAGATAGYTAAAVSQARRGIMGTIADKVHGALDAISTPEKMEAFAQKHHEAAQSNISEFEKALQNETLKHNIPKEQMDAANEIISKLKAGKFSDIPKELWKEAHEHIKAIKPILEKALPKKGFVASVPGGAATLTSAAAVLGGVLAHMTFSGIEKSHQASIAQAAQKSGETVRS